MNESVQTNHPTAPARRVGALSSAGASWRPSSWRLRCCPCGRPSPTRARNRAPSTPEWFVDETKLPFDPLPGPGGAAAQRSWGVLDGAGYRIEVPANWNGELVMWAHGFAGWGAELTVSNPPFRQWLVANGYAWAASSYAKNGYVVSQGVEDTYQLAQWFTANVGTPTRVFMTGGLDGRSRHRSVPRTSRRLLRRRAARVRRARRQGALRLLPRREPRGSDGHRHHDVLPVPRQLAVGRRPADQGRARGRPRTRGPIRRPGQVPQRGRSAALRRRLAKLDRLPLRAGPTKPRGPDPRRRQPRPGVPARRRSRRVR